MLHTQAFLGNFLDVWDRHGIADESTESRYFERGLRGHKDFVTGTVHINLARSKLVNSFYLQTWAGIAV